MQVGASGGANSYAAMRAARSVTPSKKEVDPVQASIVAASEEEGESGGAEGVASAANTGYSVSISSAGAAAARTVESSSEGSSSGQQGSGNSEGGGGGRESSGQSSYSGSSEGSKGSLVNIAA